jgi:predicted ATPase
VRACVRVCRSRALLLSAGLLAGLCWAVLCSGVGSAGALGAADFLAIAAAFHTVYLTDVPALGASDHDAAKRLISAVDAFYQHRTKLVISAAVEAEQLFSAQRGAEAAAAHRREAARGDLLDSGKYRLIIS